MRGRVERSRPWLAVRRVLGMRQTRIVVRARWRTHLAGICGQRDTKLLFESVTSPFGLESLGFVTGLPLAPACR